MALPLLSRLRSPQQLVRLGLLLLKVCLFLPLPALCQGGTVLSATIPFTFSTGNRAMPAGDYVIHRTSAYTYSLIATNGSQAQSFVVYDASATKAPENNTLVFRKRGEQYFLAGIWFAGSRQGLQARTGNAERELVANAHEPTRAGQLVAVDAGIPRQP